MKIGVIGSGNVGAALARGFARNGHTVTFGVRNPTSFKGASLVHEKNIAVATVSEIARDCDVLVMAAVPQAVGEIARSLGDVSDKIIIDAMNSFRTKPEGFDNTTQALEKLTNCKHIVKCFNCTGSKNMANPIYRSGGIDMFYAGDSPQAKEVAGQLAREIGFSKVYDLGGSKEYDLLEQLAMIWITLARTSGMGAEFALNVVER